MSVSFLTGSLFCISLLTNLTVEGIKKLLENTKIKYSSNLLAAIVAIIVTIGVSVIYIIMNDIVLTLKIVVEIVILMYLSFLVSTVGYDKVVQMITQIKA